MPMPRRSLTPQGREAGRMEGAGKPRSVAQRDDPGVLPRRRCGLAPSATGTYLAAPRPMRPIHLLPVLMATRPVPLCMTPAKPRTVFRGIVAASGACGVRRVLRFGAGARHWRGLLRQWPLAAPEERVRVLVPVVARVKCRPARADAPPRCAPA